MITSELSEIARVNTQYSTFGPNSARGSITQRDSPMLMVYMKPRVRGQRTAE